MVIIFVPNNNECQAIQKFIRKLYIKELVREEEWIEKQRLEEIVDAEQKQEEANQIMEYHPGEEKKADRHRREEKVG